MTDFSAKDYLLEYINKCIEWSAQKAAENPEWERNNRRLKAQRQLAESLSSLNSDHERFRALEYLMDRAKADKFVRLNVESDERWRIGLYGYHFATDDGDAEDFLRDLVNIYNEVLDRR